MSVNLVGRLSDCCLFTYSTPADSVRPLLPRGLTLIEHEGRAFWNIVVARVEQLRPKALPAWCGMGHHFVAYRLQARAVLADGRELEGLYFLRSDVDAPMLARVGNVFTDFRFHTAHMMFSTHDAIRLAITKTYRGLADARLEAALATSATERRSVAPFLKYYPTALAVSADAKRVRIVEVMRDEQRWIERPLAVQAARWAYFAALAQNDLVLERATHVAPIDYEWRFRSESACPSKATSA